MPWLLVPLAYLLGSISFAWLAARLHGIDLRRVGSGNLGATNAARALGGRWFPIVFGLDVLKSLGPVLAARCWRPDDQVLWLSVGAAAILGHTFTCFHRFKGGKAVATSLGTLIALVPQVALAGSAVWLLCWLCGWLAFRLSRSEAVGPASVIGTATIPAFHILVFQEQPWRGDRLPLTIFLIILSVLVIVRHRTNIAKLLARPESQPQGPG